MTEPLNILVIEASNADFLMVEHHLKKNGLSVRCSRVDSLEGLKEAFDRESWDLVLSNYDVPQLDFLDCLNLVQAQFPKLPVVLVTGSVGEEKAVDLLKLGVQDVVLKENLARLVPSLLRSLKEKKEVEERRRAEARLIESEAMYRSLFDNMLNGFAYCRMIFEGDIPKDFVYLSVNDAFEDLTGLRNVVGKRVTEVIPGIRASDPALFDKYGRVALTGNPERFEIYVEALRTWFRISVYSPAREYFVAVFEVITEHKLAEKALRESEAKTRSILDNIGIGVALISRKMEVLELNHLMRNWFPAVDPRQCSICYRVFNNPPRDEVCGICPTQKTLQDGLVHEDTVRTEQAGGARNYRIVSSPVFNASGEVAAAIEMVEDITDKLSLEAQLRQSQKIEAIGQLAGGVAHDFNNILTAIFGYSELILNQVGENDPVKNHVEEIMKASKRAAALTQGLLAFSRKQAVALAVIDLNEVILGNGAFLRRLIREDIELKINCAGEPLSVLADRVQIEQVIMNLVANARDAMPNGGKLLVETTSVTLDQEFVETHGYGKAGIYALITVSDSGFGMDKEVQSRIFEPFFTTKEEGQGTGLGLSMAYGIIKKHDGCINAYSESGTGTIFKIYLPRVSAAAQAAIRRPNQAVALRGGTETVLVCEDEAELRKLAVNVLSHFGYRVIEAEDGQDAVEKFVADKEKIDLVIIDAIMPKKNGKVAFDEMKIVRPDLKTIFVSGYARDIFEEDNTFDENTIFLHKPFSPNDLLAGARELLDKK